MKYVKGLAALIILLGVGAALVWQFYLKDQAAFAKVATAYTAKMVCSCIFVAERELESCMTDFTEDITALDIEVKDHSGPSGQTRTVIARAPFGLSRDTASFEPGLGCALSRP